MINRRILVISRSPALSRAIQASLGPGYQVVTSSNVIDVEEEVRDEGPFDILVAGPVFDSHAGMARLANLRAMSAVPAVVLALGPKPKANLGDIVRTGAVELVEYPTSKRQLASALKRAFDIADAPSPAPAPPSRRSPTASWWNARTSRRCSRSLRRAAAAARPSTPLTWPATWPRRPGNECAWSISTSNSARSRPRCTCGPGSPSRTCSPGSRSTRTTSTSTWRNTSRTMSSDSPCWRRRSAPPTRT